MFLLTVTKEHLKELVSMFQMLSTTEVDSNLWVTAFTDEIKLIFWAPFVDFDKWRRLSFLFN